MVTQRIPMQDFRTLVVWQKAHHLTLELYRLTSSFPRSELFGLVSQIRRSGSSIGANIAEGCGRGGKEFARFLQIAAGSASETEYHLILAKDLGFLEATDYDNCQERTLELKRMLTSLRKKVRPSD
jgi:four helix bundle protein